MLRRLSPLLFPAFGLSLLLLRHHPLVAAHWLAFLQAPRLAGFGAALWWALGERGGRKDERPSPKPEPLTASGRQRRRPAAGPLSQPRATVVVHPASSRPPPQGLPPSHAIAASLLLADGLIAAWGFWADWGWVRAGSVAAWVVVAAIGWRAGRDGSAEKSTGPLN